MNKQIAWIFFGFKWLLFTAVDPLPAAANLVFSEDFSSVIPGVDQHFAHSERWGPATEYWLEPTDTNNVWTFNEAIVLSINPGNPADRAVAPNEVDSSGTPGTNGEMTTVPIPGFIPGQWYSLTFEHWGDDRPFNVDEGWVTGYTLEVELDLLGGGITTIARGPYPEYNPALPGFVTETILFVATAVSHTLTFRDVTTVGEASANLDNIIITAIPETRQYLTMSAGAVLIALLSAAARGRARFAQRGAA
jgi:hypothetical protein